MYVDPPRRGNGAYWTLLAEGIDEVERCMKLFTTLRPPIIDKSSIYYTGENSSQQVVRSRGQFIPALNSEIHSIDIETEQEFEGMEELKQDKLSPTEDVSNELPVLAAQSVNLKHPLEYYQEYPRAYPPSIQPFNGPTATSALSIGTCNHMHLNEHSNSSFPDLSFLTPMKSDLFSGVPDGILLSPLPSHSAITPQNKKYVGHMQNTLAPHNSFSPLSTPLKPLTQETGSDSGVFSPSNLHFYTPIKDIGELLQLNTPRGSDLFNQFESTPYSAHPSNKSLLWP